MSYLLATFLIILDLVAPIDGLQPRNLDEVPAPPNSTEVKCGGCSACNNPCNQSPPPTPPATSPPPPPPKKPPTPSLNYPPPPSSYIYITGPPGDLYPVDPYISGSSWSSVVGLPLLVGCGFLGLLAFW